MRATVIVLVVGLVISIILAIGGYLAVKKSFELLEESSKHPLVIMGENRVDVGAKFYLWIESLIYLLLGCMLFLFAVLAIVATMHVYVSSDY